MQCGSVVMSDVVSGVVSGLVRGLDSVMVIDVIIVV